MTSTATPLVSVLLPVRNAHATLARAIESIRAQTLREGELLVIDDGSTDETPALLAALATADPRLRILTQPALGLVAALNHGLAHARAPLIARMDADDVSSPRRLAAQADLLNHQPALELVGCGVVYGGDRAAQAGYAHHVDWLNQLVTPDEIARARFIEAPFAHPSVMFRRSVVERLGGYAEGDFPEDYELWLRWLDAGVRAAKVPEPLLIWHDPPTRLSRRDPRYGPEAFYRLKAKWIARELARCATGREIWIWGAGRPTRKRAAHLLAHGVAIRGYVDIDPRKIGGRIGAAPVIAPEELGVPANRFVLSYVGNRGSRTLIRDWLVAHGWAEGRDFLLCA